MTKMSPKKPSRKTTAKELQALETPEIISSSTNPAPAQSPLARYLSEVARFPLLSPEEEKMLALQAFNEKDKEAIKKLVQANLRFVIKIAFEYARYGARVLDLIQEGNIGLLKAVQEFNPYKDVRLTTYAVYWIRSYIQDFLLRNWSIVRVGTTAAQKKLFYKLKKEQEKLEREGLAFTPKAIAMNLGVSEDDVNLMRERLSSPDVSINAPLSKNTDEAEAYNLAGRITDPSPLASTQLEESEQGVMFKKALGEFVTELDEKEQKIFRERLVSEKPKTLSEIGDEYGFSKERARQLEERILKKLRAFLAKNYPDISVN